MVLAAAWMMYHSFGLLPQISVELVCYYYSTVHQDGSQPRRTDISLTFCIRLVHITEELTSIILHEDGSQPRRTGISLTFYIRLVHITEELISIISTWGWFTAQKNWYLTFCVRLVHITEGLISNILHEDGSHPRRTGISLTFYIRIVAFATRINSDLRQYTVGVLNSITKRYTEIQTAVAWVLDWLALRMTTLRFPYTALTSQKTGTTAWNL